MPDSKPVPRYRVGDEVRVFTGVHLVGRVMRVKGAHSPGGHTLYTVYVPMEPEPLKLLVREEEIVQE